MAIRIRIVKTPQGDAPEEIRNLWIGCEFNCLGGPYVVGKFGRQRSVITHELCEDPKPSYEVQTDHAFEELKRRNPEAYAWWAENVTFGSITLAFDESCAEVIGEV